MRLGYNDLLSPREHDRYPQQCIRENQNLNNMSPANFYDPE
jgi:hypothetical protein